MFLGHTLTRIRVDMLFPGVTPMTVVLCGNKCDLPVKVDDAEVRRTVEELGFVTHLKTSARNNINIDAAARALVEECVFRWVFCASDRLLAFSSCSLVLHEVFLIRMLCCATFPSAYKDSRECRQVFADVRGKQGNLQRRQRRRETGPK